MLLLIKKNQGLYKKKKKKKTLQHEVGYFPADISQIDKQLKPSSKNPK